MRANLLDDVVLSGTTLDFSNSNGRRWALTFSRYTTDSEQALAYGGGGIYMPVSIAQEFKSIGLLYHRPFLDKTDLFVSAENGSWKYWFMNTPRGAYKHPSEDGYRFGLGLKSRPFNRFEAGLQVRRFRYTDPSVFSSLEDEITDTVAEGNFYFSRNFSLGGAYITNDYSDRFTITLGYSP
jgi:hypothetical protein